MKNNAWTAVIAKLLFGLSLFFYFAASGAACNCSEINDMVAAGDTFKDIADDCGLSSKQARQKWKTCSGDSETSPNEAFPSGTALHACGCFGAVPFGYKESSSQCKSGVAVATPCPGACIPMGGSPWQRVCQ